MRGYLKPAVLLLVAVVAACYVPAADAQVPSACAQYRWTMTRNVQKFVGINAPLVVFAAQVQQESGCDALARSRVGAGGLTQFMPATAAWIPQLDASLSPVDVYDPAWALKAQVVYMAWLLRRNPGATECDAYAFALSSYNGGEGWLRRDQKVTRAANADASRWFGHVAEHPDRRRAQSAIDENRGYPKRILLTLSPRYVAAGWGRALKCGSE